jgi:hypothetical protein
MKPLKKLYPWLFLVSVLPTAYGQGNANTAREYRIPFVLTEYNNISVTAILNGSDTVQLMLHTAASSVTIVEEAAQRAKSIAFNGTDTGVKSWGGQENSSRYSDHNSLQIGEMVWTDITIGENKYSGQFTDGKFGLDLFQGKAIAIDFEKKVIIVRNDLPRVKGYEKLKLTTDKEFMFVEAGMETEGHVLQRNFLIHSGYSGALLLDDLFVQENKLGEKLRIVGTKELKDSYGNILKTQRAIVPAFTIGQVTLRNVTAGFFEGAIGRQKMSIMGGELLKRFKIVIDGKRDFVYLKLSEQSS